MADVYRITGETVTYNYQERRFIRTGVRKTVTRRGGSYAYYEDLDHAKRGLAGLRGNGRDFTDLRIQIMAGEWVDV